MKRASEQPPQYDLQTRALFHNVRHPRRHALYQGVVAGAFFATMMGVTIYGSGRLSAVVAVLAALALGAVFGFVMGYVFRSQNRDMAVTLGFPVGTHSERAVRAYELLLLGRPGDDPVTNEVARKGAEKTLASRSGAWFTVPLCLVIAVLVAGMGVRQYLDPGPVFPSVFYWVLSVLLVAGAAMSVPLNARLRRRARGFLRGMEDRDRAG
ncbi:hypothetical protein [Nocardiopsis oceani]